MKNNEGPILFSDILSRAIIADRKTQTRRELSPGNSTVSGYPAKRFWDRLDFDSDKVFVDPGFGAGEYLHVPMPSDGSVHRVRSKWEVGQKLWVRETHYRVGHWELVPGEFTKKLNQPKWRFVGTAEMTFDPPTDFLVSRPKEDPGCDQWYKRLGRFMPRAFSRTTLDIKRVWPERLHDIDVSDAIDEGVCFEMDKPEGPHQDMGGEKPEPPLGPDPVERFAALWREINGKESWEANRWVWCLSFKRIKP